MFLRWLAAYSEAEVFTAAEAVLADPDTIWEDSGLVDGAPSRTAGAVATASPSARRYNSDPRLHRSIENCRS
ncbi:MULTISPECIES: hypothetical protein [Streptomyces]|uniref:Uncharacterized protein n=1 Tax=Streptomyces glycanivorans TaxID=3033808 RepID=A0ABY9JLL8_9ACTN|nr:MULTISPECIES: hypothetical protein [unclassified Streptomyces]WSQ81997.1 immunity 21 family protein [Streptomyces sp. NBC_01213]WLQ68640.1 hypothetical protein P8A20_36085 [Streptomyces sp. Alt3]WSQ89324.1 immunity 21 family protein [Streptomyces sp. NBC_01212]WSR04668.1 immunity 21 family protein [Streptomyces sp. NBC_01208]WSR52716.1 immunity 21 family protein [Streptomyces sp. NBC_01201]